MNLIERQERAINRLLSIPPVSRRGAGILQTRMQRGARREFERAAARMSYRPEQIEQQWRDIKDMAILRRISEEDTS